MKKIIKLLLSSTTGIIILFLIILVPVLMIMDFLGANITDGYIENNSENLNKKIEVGYVFTALLAIAIGGVDNRREEMVAILIAVMIFSIGCSLEANKINEYYKCGFFKLKELFLDEIKNIDEDMIYDLGKISYNFKSKRVTG